jgi:MFS superfamily sulfate permease-like transporter
MIDLVMVANLCRGLFKGYRGYKTYSDSSVNAKRACSEQFSTVQKGMHLMQ